MKNATICLCVIALLIAPAAIQAEVKANRIFGDSMVLQRGMSVPVWGTAQPDEEVTVTFAKQTKTAKADKDGKWTLKLDAMDACATAGTMTIGKTTFKDVLVGDVWVGSGQSNMEWVQRSTLNAAEEAKSADYPLIRHIKFQHAHGPELKDDIKGDWTVCSPETVSAQQTS